MQHLFAKKIKSAIDSNIMWRIIKVKMSTICCLEEVLNRLQRIWLLNARKRKNLTHAEIAKMVNVKRQYYGMIENGQRTPSVFIAKKIARVLDVDWTLFFEDESNESLTKDHCHSA